MRFVTFRSGQSLRPGLLTNPSAILDIPLAYSIAKQHGLEVDANGCPQSVLDVIQGGPRTLLQLQDMTNRLDGGALQGAVVLADSADIVAPIPRPTKNVFCVGKNYRAHIAEGNRARKTDEAPPEYPVFFTKPPTAVTGPDAPILFDPSVSDRMDYEVELGVVIGKAGRNITVEDAIEHIFGFTIINDVTARDLQRRHGGQFLKGKGLDTFCPMGPSIVTIDELSEFDSLEIGLTVNGEVRQVGNTGSMIFPIAQLLASLSEGMTLEPGDILATGTPSGVGYAMEPPVFLKDGDTITCQIEGIGTLTNPVRSVAARTVGT